MKKVIVILFCALSLFFTVGVAKGEVSGEAYVVSILPQMEIKRECLYTEEEMVMAEYIIQQEVRGASIEHKKIIAQVILNRVKNDAFPDNVYDVLFQKGQFTSAQNYINKKYPPDEDTKRAVYEVFNGECEDLSKGALYFYAPRWTAQKTSNWFENKLTFLFELEGHRFFK